MTVEEALVILEAGLAQGRLTRIQELVFRQAWEGQSYSLIAANYGYDAGYIKNIASELWRILSTALGEKVTKSNVQSVLKRRPYPTSVLAIPATLSCTDNGHALKATVNGLDTMSGSSQRRDENFSSPRLPTPDSPLPIFKLDSQTTVTSRYQDWGEAIDTSFFYGRTAELTTLRKWIVNERCRLVALLGLGGIGKTALSVKLAQQLENQFEYVIWRSLCHAPSVQELLANLLDFLDPGYRNGLPINSNYQLSRLIELLRKQRCLLILDNVESILYKGDFPFDQSPHGDRTASHYTFRVGSCPYGYEGYGELFKQVGEASHQSCLVLTSREIPKEIAILQGESRPVRSLQLTGLGLEAKELLKTKGLSNSEDELKALVERYEGNPLALMIAAETIKEVFNNSIVDFNLYHPIVFGEICELLSQQFYRLSHLEKEVMYWLAINRIPVSIKILITEILSLSSKQTLTETLGCLKRRSLIKVSNSSDGVFFTLQPLVMEYMTTRLIKESCEEILSLNINLLNNHALIQVQANDFVRVSQFRCILKPVLTNLIAILGRKQLEDKLKQILSSFQKENLPLPLGYTARNVLNLLCGLQTNLDNCETYNLTVFPFNLQKEISQTVNVIHY
ncbi:MAG TPA: hypothetical protein DCP31_05495 [Cyanobacteria bacterium UBA8543]|nr:hypothetical protein [Cyanobacteria bacterium UBA8543]